MTPLETAPGWEARPCLETPIELWYGPDDDARRETNTERGWRELTAIRICGDCSVRAACLANELRRPISDQWGVRGGLTAQRRKALIRSCPDQERRTA
jgi:hypothetical protein